MDIKKTIASLSPLEKQALPYLEKAKDLDTLMQQSGMVYAQAMRALQWLSNKKLVSFETISTEFLELDTIGQDISKQGLPEKRFLKAIEKKSVPMSDLAKVAKLDNNEVNVCLGLLRRTNAISMEKGEVSITDNGKKQLTTESDEEKLIKKLQTKIQTDSLSKEEQTILNELKRRKQFIKTSEHKTTTIVLLEDGKKVLKAGLDSVKVVENITQDMIRSGSWKDQTFRRYDVALNVPKTYGGKKHFVKQAITYIKKIFLEMGFEEMEGRYSDTAFWDMDSLFIPQDHPARQMQDTFYLENPETGALPELAKKVGKIHEKGVSGSIKGWGGKYDESESSKLMMRTHTTVMSAHTLTKLTKDDLPKKYFAVGKVFRNEALDWKHLFEFHQVEGVVIDPNANFTHLMGYLREFYKKMGYSDIRIRPAYFPYTEPSLEVDAYHPIKKQWFEVGGAGMFRPEVSIALLGFECPILAWGQGMERIISSYYELSDVRDLYRNDIKQMNEMKMWLK